MDHASVLGDLPLYPRSKYAGELRPLLPAHVFALSRSRVALVPIYLLVIVVATVAVARHWIPWALAPIASLVIGASFACLTFVAHEALHGAIVRGKTRQRVVGWLGFLPFMLSPRLWIAWHNQSHHAETNLPNDPDSYPTLEQYRAHASARFAVDAFSLGGGRWRGMLSLILGFTVQSANQLVNARARGFLDRREHRLAIVEAAGGVVLWATVAIVVGLPAFVFVFVIPLLLANACVMAFILTNHSLSPRVPINDPLISGLSVTTPRWIEWVTLSFGAHVEHHLFPAMSSRHAASVRALVRQCWPDRYQSMSLAAAVRRLHRTARVYKDAITLVDPTTGDTFATLLPRTATADQELATDLRQRG